MQDTKLWPEDEDWPNDVWWAPWHHEFAEYTRSRKAAIKWNTQNF